MREPTLVDVYHSLSTGIRPSRLRLYPEQLFSIDFPVPSKEEQQKIVDYLEWKISKINALINNLKKQVRAINEEKQVENFRVSAYQPPTIYNDNSKEHVALADIILNAKLRNAIGHNDVEYDTVTQCITYIPNPKDCSKRKQEYLLQFENEALRMFQGVLVISEYIYRLRQLTLMEKGITPIRPNTPIVKSKKIGRNEPCPCGSGKKFKHCHGRNG